MEPQQLPQDSALVVDGKLPTTLVVRAPTFHQGRACIRAGWLPNPNASFAKEPHE